MIGKLAGLLKENFDREHAHLKGVGHSEARMIKQAKDIPDVAKRLSSDSIARPIKGAVIRMRDGKAMVFCTDGSLRHAAGRRLMKAERKALKKARRKQLHVRDVEISRAQNPA